MSDVVLGIDLGTTNSVVAVADGGHARVLADADDHRLIPSVVSFPEEGGVVVGEVARERRLMDAANTVYAIKRLIGRPFDSPEVRRAQERFAFDLVEGPNAGVRVRARQEIWSLAEISAYVLRECRRVAEQVLGTTCTKAVVTVPANFNELQRSATKAAGTVAGLDVVRILNEPTAAAIAYGYGSDGTRERVAIYDLGGGTFDITILELEQDVFEVVATAGNTFLGGDDIDLLLAEEMSDSFEDMHGWDPRTDSQAFERLRAAGEWAKCILSSQTEVDIEVAALHHDDGGRAMDLALTLTRGELEDRILSLVDKSLQVCEEALRLGSLKGTDIDHVVLVGGSTRIPLVREMVSQFFDRRPRTDFDPDLVVALGAAIQGYALAGDQPGEPVSALRGPPASVGEAVKLTKQAARAMRPAQPAFAPPLSPSATPIIPTSRPPPPMPDESGLPGLEMTIPSIQLDPEYEALLAEESPGALQHFDTSVDVELDVGLDTEAEPTMVDVPVPRVRPPDPPPPAQPSPTGSDPSMPSNAVQGLPSVLFVGDVEPQATPQPPEQPAGPQAPRHGAPAAEPPPRPPPQDLPPVLLFDGPSETDADAPQPAALPPAAPQTREDRSQELLQSLDLASAGPMASAGPVVLGPEPAATAPQPLVELPPRPAPLLMDVTPLSLGIETVGGYCEHIIRRNVPIPAEQVRAFTTAADNQNTVRVSICQGESRDFEQNQALGVIELSGLRRARRGEVKIDVTFLLDANGTLDVRAADADTGRAQTTRINLVGGFESEELEQLRQRQEATLAD